MKIYIAGQITGDPEYKARFEAAEATLKGKDNIILNPAVLPAGLTTAEYMTICKAMIDAADKIVLLPGYYHSGGASLEAMYAAYIYKPMRTLTESEAKSDLRVEPGEQRLIDANALLRHFTTSPTGDRYRLHDCDNFPITVNLESVQKAIRSAPTIDPVKHGKWVCHSDPNKVALVCSVCGQAMPFVPEYLPEEPPYCNCGARMDGEKYDS